MNDRLMEEAVFIARQAREERTRRLNAERAARYRAAHPGRPDERATDKALVEALVVHALTLDPEAATALLESVASLAGEGLRFRGYGENASRNRPVRRLRYFADPTPNSGSVRAAVRERQARDAVTGEGGDLTLLPHSA